MVAATRLGNLVRQVAGACLLGFVSGIGVWMVGSQLDSLLGLPADHPAILVGDVADVVRQLPDASVWSSAVSVATLALLVLVQWLRPRRPGAALAVAAGIGAVALFDLSDHGVATVGPLPAGLSMPQVPPLGSLGPSAIVAVLAIVVIGMVEMTAVARDQRQPATPFSARRETAALATVSLGAGLFGGMPVAGAPGRSALARDAGARTPLPSLVLGIGVVVLLEVGSTWLEALPIPVVAAVVVFAGARLTRPGRLRALPSTDPRRGWLAITTLVATLVSVELGVATLVALSAFEARTGRSRGRPRQRP